MSVFYMSTIVIEMILGLNIEMIPKSFHHFVDSKLIVMPCR